MTFDAHDPGDGASIPNVRRTTPVKLLRTALVGAALIIYTAVLAEAYIRVLDPQALMPRYVTATPWGVRGNIPNARYWNHTPEVDVEYRINGQGLRAERNYPQSKPPGACRVALFGDSFFFGVELALPESIAGQLEARLNAAGYRAEVLNFAVGGFGTAEMLQTFDKFGRRFEPDVVIFSWDDSDSQDNVRSGLYRLDSGRLVQAGDEYLPGIKTLDWLMHYRLYRALADHSQLYSFARNRTEAFVKSRMRRASREGTVVAQAGGEIADDDAAANVAQKAGAIALSAALVLRAHDLATASGADFYLVEIPYKLSRTRFRPAVDVLPAAVRNKINIVETSTAFSKAARPELKLFYETGQGHMTPKGVAVFIDEMVKKLDSSPRLAACKYPGSAAVGAR